MFSVGSWVLCAEKKASKLLHARCQCCNLLVGFRNKSTQINAYACRVTQANELTLPAVNEKFAAAKMAAVYDR